MHRTLEQLDAGLPRITASPRDQGRVDAIVVRPQVDGRQELESVILDEQLGAIGDRWGSRQPTLPSQGQSSDALASQLTLMNSRVAELLAGTRDRWALAGDQLYVDLDLSESNLRPGDRLNIGPAVLEITSKAHLGCRKFAARFGEAALAWVNSPDGRRLHLRGLYARVVTQGTIRTGDAVRVTPKA